MTRLLVPDNERQRIHVACDPCRHGKAKCDGGNPCSRCTRAKLPPLVCQYSGKNPKIAANQESQPSAAPALPLGLLNSDHLHHDATPVAEQFTNSTDPATIVTWNTLPEHCLNGLSSPDEDSPVATTPQPASHPIGGAPSLAPLGPSKIWPPAQDMSSLSTESVEWGQGEGDRQETQLMPNDNMSVDSAIWSHFFLSLTVREIVQLGFTIVPPLDTRFTTRWSSSLSPPAQDMSQQYAQHYQPTQLAGAGFSRRVTSAHLSYVLPQTPAYVCTPSNGSQREWKALLKESRQPAAASAQTTADSRIPTDSTQPLMGHTGSMAVQLPPIGSYQDKDCMYM
ncbi:hypothetical protein V8F33_009318 [Rhypophila sp. PSN 637]